MLPESNHIAQWVQDNDDRAREIAARIYRTHRDKQGRSSRATTIEGDLDALVGVTHNDQRHERVKLIEAAITDTMIEEGWGVDDVGIDVEDDADFKMNLAEHDALFRRTA